MDMDTELKNKVLGIMSRVLKINEDGVKISVIGGGFTGASKYLLETEGKRLFLKVADSRNSSVDASLVAYEAEIYQFLEKVGLTEILFPRYEKLIDEDGVKILIIDYLSDVTWGGPWNIETIEKLDVALEKLHSKKVSDIDLDEIEKISGEVLTLLGQELHPKKLNKEEMSKKNKPFFDAWDKKKCGFTNSDGEVYFAGNRNFAEVIVEETMKDFDEEDKVLTMHDLNFANICFSEKQAYFVDPLFLRMGYADRDRAVVGVNILQQLGKSANQELRKMVIDKYITNKMVLASLIKYYVTTTARKMDSGSKSFQKFHQECAEVALELFRDWDFDRK